MSNLGRYQELVTEAKSLGGVENYLNLIEANAVANAAPRLVVRGAVVTLVAVGGIAAVALEVKRRIDARSALAEAAGAARDSLTSVRPDDNAVDDLEQTTTGTGVGTCSWCDELGHDKRSCGVPLDAEPCSICGFRGHEMRNCPHTGLA